MANIIRFAYDPYDEQAFMNIYYKFGLPISKQAAQNACRQSRESGKPILEELASGANGSVRSGLQSVLQALSIIPNDSASDALERIWTALRYRQYVKRAQLDVGKYIIQVKKRQARERNRNQGKTNRPTVKSVKKKDVYFDKL